MSTTKEAGAAVEVVPALTFKERLAKRRVELESDATIDLAVPGYEKLGLWARYRVLGYEEIRGIGRSVEDETQDQITAEKLTAADTLVEACIELLELKGYDKQGKPIFETTQYRWTATAARELFDATLPDGASAREAVMAIFPYPRDMLMMTHHQEYLTQAMGYMPEIEKILQGESQAASAATTSDSSPQRQ